MSRTTIWTLVIAMLSTVACKRADHSAVKVYGEGSSNDQCSSNAEDHTGKALPLQINVVTRDGEKAYVLTHTWTKNSTLLKPYSKLMSKCGMGLADDVDNPSVIVNWQCTSGSFIVEKIGNVYDTFRQPFASFNLPSCSKNFVHVLNVRFSQGLESLFFSSPSVFAPLSGAISPEDRSWLASVTGSPKVDLGDALQIAAGVGSKAEVIEAVASYRAQKEEGMAFVPANANEERATDIVSRSIGMAMEYELSDR